jgi:hypothetical protein
MGSVRGPLACLAWLFCMGSVATSGVGGGVQSGSVPFTALHTYYMSATGSDSNNGTSAATAWATPNHQVVCGDVIVAASGTYTSSFGAWGTVSNCPSTSGGIDGAGGIWMAVVLCGGSDLESCKTTNKLWGMNKSNWAVEGWKVTNPGTGSGSRAFELDGSGGLIHHLALINDVAFNVASGFHSDDGGKTGAFGVDYWASVGNIAQNAAQNDSFCEAAIDAVGIGVLDTNAGTHVFFDGNFSYANTATGCGSDTEDYMVDTLDQHNVNSQIVLSNNIGFGADRECIHTFWQQISTNTPTIKIYNNTCYQNNVNTHGDFAWGEIDNTTNDGTGTVNNPWIITVKNNLAYQPLSASAGGGRVYAYMVTNVSAGLTVSGNFFRANSTVCPSHCNSTYDVLSWGTLAELNTSGNTYTKPAFTNTTDLLANRLGVPNCAGFTTTTKCMGYDPNTPVLTTPSIISDLVPTASGTSGKGYQLPSTTCAANPDYPTWLKGIVYLHWNSGTSTITENGGLVTKPCGM